MKKNIFHQQVSLSPSTNVVPKKNSFKKVIKNTNTNLSEIDLFVMYINDNNFEFNQIKSLYINIIDLINSKQKLPKTINNFNLQRVKWDRPYKAIYVSNNLENISFFVGYNKEYGWINVSNYTKKLKNNRVWRINDLVLCLDQDNKWCLDVPIKEIEE